MRGSSKLLCKMFGPQPGTRNPIQVCVDRPSYCSGTVACWGLHVCMASWNWEPKVNLGTLMGEGHRWKQILDRGRGRERRISLCWFTTQTASSLQWVSPQRQDLEAQGHPSSTAFQSGATRTPASTPMGCRHCRWRISPLSHRAGPETLILTRRLSNSSLD